MFQSIKCPNCKVIIPISKNIIYCEVCGYKHMPENKDDFLQPTDPRFKKVYGYDPIAQAKEEKRKKENAKQEREDMILYKAKKGLSPLKIYEAREIIKYARKGGLE